MIVRFHNRVSGLETFFILWAIALVLRSGGGCLGGFGLDGFVYWFLGRGFVGGFRVLAALWVLVQQLCTGF